MHVDAEGRPVLKVNATQTIAASTLNMRNISGVTDTATITAANFNMRAVSGSRDSVLADANTFTVAANTATLLLGGTAVLTVDTSPYARSAFFVRADFISLLTTVFLQLAPVNTNSYFETAASEAGLVLGGEYLLIPTVPLRYARIFATGIGSILTAYYIGQA